MAGFGGKCLQSILVITRNQGQNRELGAKSCHIFPFLCCLSLCASVRRGMCKTSHERNKQVGSFPADDELILIEQTVPSKTQQSEMEINPVSVCLVYVKQSRSSHRIREKKDAGAKTSISLRGISLCCAHIFIAFARIFRSTNANDVFKQAINGWCCYET